MEKDYQTGLCEFGETVLFRLPGLCDRCMSGRHLARKGRGSPPVVGNGSTHKVRTVCQVVPSRQWTEQSTAQSTECDPLRPERQGHY